MKEQNLSSNYRSLEQYYMAKVIKSVEEMGANAIVWQDVFDNGMVLNNKTIVHVWKGKNPNLQRV
jgi:N-acetyl-beta-hexosaminidase